MATAIDKTLFDAKGDILVATAADTPGKLALGTNGYYLKVNTSTATGLEWAQVDLSSYLTSSTAASTYATITTIKLLTDGGNYNSGSMFTLYGITAA